MENSLVSIQGLGELDSTLRQFDRYPMLSQEEEYHLARRYRQYNDLEAAHTLVTSYLRYVVRIARDYSHYGLSVLDLVQEGAVGLMNAVKRFDPDKGFRLSTYALWWIKAAIQEFILRSWSLVRIGTTTAQRKLFFSLRKLRRNIGQMDRQEAQRIATELGVETGEVIEMAGRLSGRDSSLNAPAVEDGDELQDLLPDRRPNAEAILLAREGGNLRQEKVVRALGTLDAREQRIVRERFMTDEPKTLDELGALMGISRERVRQLEKRAMEKLRTLLAPLQADLVVDAA
ncbi:MAG: RNA polymerase sigma factor RpoH [Magnetococcales bacterium]|nr:RNA polymerase sigma factor RpoH [Magnetococcales bacterium]